MTEEKLTTLQELERSALTIDRYDFDRYPIIQIVSALRKYRSAAQELLSQRYTDGECDAVALHNFAEMVKEIEEEGGH